MSGRVWPYRERQEQHLRLQVGCGFEVVGRNGHCQVARHALDLGLRLARLGTGKTAKVAKVRPGLTRDPN